ncbi:hypothetical protein ARALYDRAFT_904461 [Arabidopsis lyrata subsp. lyrata]|uniref:Uncharacterized protein n=1 Tax=Arabidopsis lyrata subsp. lyrata TaxID=81972 RepID=D7LQ20_ARALL|nr:hypothetical protein ARALYDRAFT_904461 [Arabidopsis lyrata subsp. lyrata]
MHEHFRKLVQRLKKTLRLSASDKSHGVTEPLSLDDLPEECISLIIYKSSRRVRFGFGFENLNLNLLSKPILCGRSLLFHPSMNLCVLNRKISHRRRSSFSLIRDESGFNQR